jgi:hypothetical protein
LGTDLASSQCSPLNIGVAAFAGIIPICAHRPAFRYRIKTGLPQLLNNPEAAAVALGRKTDNCRKLTERFATNDQYGSLARHGLTRLCPG